MPIGEPSEDDLYLAKLTTDEVGEPTQDPFTAKGQLANALDEAVFNPDDPVPGENLPEEKDPRGETDGELEGIEQGNTPDTPTMDTKPKSAKDSLAEAFDSVFSMDERVEDQKPTIVPPQYDGRKRPGDDDDNENQKNEIGDADTPADNTDRIWLKKKYESVKPELPPSLGGKPKTDENGLTYLEYTFTVDPEKYESNNYHPIPEGADAKQAGTETLLKKKDLEERARRAEKPEESEEIEVAEVQEKETTDEAPEKVVLDYASYIDGSSFMCFDEVEGIDYTQIAMDASPKKAVPKPNCKTTFAQCRAKNPLYCRFHGPKLLEKDIKQALTALLGKNNCVISVTKDKDAPTPMTFRLTVGCTPAMKDKVEDMVHKFLTQNPGIKSKEDWKDLGYDKGKIMETEEFEMDVLQADKPPKSSDWALQAKYDTEKAKAAGKKQAVVGETPSKIEKIAKGEAPLMGEKKPKEEEEETGKETDVENVGGEEAEKPAAPKKAFLQEDYQKQFSDLADEAIDKNLFDDPDFKAKYDAIYNSGDEMEKQVENLSALVKEFSEKMDKSDQAYKKARANVKKALKGTKYEKAKLGIVKWDADEKFPFKVAIDTTYGDTLLAEMDGNGNIMQFSVYNPVDGWYGENPPTKLNETIAEYEQSIKSSGEPDAEEKLETIENEFANDIGESSIGNSTESISENNDAITSEQKEAIGKEILDGLGETYIGTLNMIYNAIDQGADKNKVKELAGKLYAESLDPEAPQVMDDTAKAIETVASVLGLGDVEFDGADVNFLEPKGKVIEEIDGNDKPQKTWNSAMNGIVIKTSAEMSEVQNAPGFSDLLGKWNDAVAEGDVDKKQAIADDFKKWSNKFIRDYNNKSEKDKYDTEYSSAEKETDAIMQDYHENYFDNEDCMIASEDLKSALHNLQNLKGNIEAIQKSLDNLGSYGQLTASDVVAKETLSNSLKKFKDSWPEAKKHYDSMKKALEDSIEAAKGIDIDKVKAGAAGKVEGVVKSIARQMFPNGKTEGVESVAQLIDYKLDSVKKLAKGWDDEQIAEMMDMNGLTEAYKAAVNAANDFDMAVNDFKDAMNGPVEDKDKSTEKTVTDPKYVKDIVETAAEEVSKKGQSLVAAMDKYNESLSGAKDEIEMSLDMEKETKLEAEAESAEEKDKTAVEKIKEALKGTDYKFDEGNMIHPKDGTIWTDNLLKDEEGYPVFDKLLEAGFNPETGKVSYVATKSNVGKNEEFDKLEDALSYLGIDGKSAPSVSEQQKSEELLKGQKAFNDFSAVFAQNQEKFEDADFTKEYKEKVLPIYSKGLASADASKIEEALKAFNALLDKHKNDEQKAQASNASGEALSEEQQIDKITGAIDKAMKDDADDIEFWTGGGLEYLGANYHGKKDLEDIIKKMNESLSGMGYEAYKKYAWGNEDKPYDIGFKPSMNSMATKETVQSDSSQKKVYTKEMLAAMSPKEKLTKGLAVIKKKLAQDPDNANLKALQAKVEKQLAALQ